MDFLGKLTFVSLSTFNIIRYKFSDDNPNQDIKNIESLVVYIIAL